MATAFRIPAPSVRAVADRFGAAGLDWVAPHNEALASFAERHSLVCDGVIDGGLAQNVIFLVSQAGEPGILKTGYPEPELFTELAVLQHWQGRSGCVQLQAADPVNGIMLMERVTPGQPFRREPVANRSVDIPRLFEQTTLAAVDEGFPSYADWLARAFTQYERGQVSDFDSHLARARSISLELLTPGTAQCVIHGDLHHENLLRGERGWVAIDPKGVIAPPVMNYGRFIHNFMVDEAGDMTSIQAVLKRRVNALAGHFSSEQLLQVGYLDLVLSVCWTLNDGGSLTPAVHLLLESYARLF